MSSQPYLCTGRITLSVPTTGLIHKIRWPVNITTPIITPAGLNLYNPVGGSTSWQLAIQAAWNLLRSWFATGDPAPSAVLEQFEAGAFVPLQSFALTGSGTSGNPVVQASEYTLTFKSAQGHGFKTVLLETSIGGANHIRYPTGASFVDAFMANTLSTANPTDIGNWAHTRGGDQITRALAVTVALNKRVRRRRNLI